MIIDNIDHLNYLLEFSDDDTFYVASIICRRKENPGMAKNDLIIAEYYIKSHKDIRLQYPLIKNLCEVSNSRFYINPNPKSLKRAALKTNSAIGIVLENSTYWKANKIYSSVCKKLETKKGQEDTWIIDLDTHTKSQAEDVIASLYNLSPIGTKVRVILPTPNGFHLLTRGFDTRHCSIPFEDIKKNSFTLVYYNDEKHITERNPSDSN
jgi:hypothetical protein